MSQDPLERILTSEAWIAPSPGFTVAVMEAVRREAAFTSPLAFPWRRALPLMILGTAVLVAVVVTTAISLGSPPSTSAGEIERWVAAAAADPLARIGLWAVLGLVVSYVSVRIALRGAELPE